MCSVCRVLLFVSAAVALQAAELRVCADPNNLPYSNSRGQGFENELAQLVARDLGRVLRYDWAPQRGRYLKKGLYAGRCDVLMGTSTGLQEVATTHPYYRSSYVFVARQDPRCDIRTFDDACLQRARIGIHVLQNEDATVPPARVLISHGLLRNISWYKLYPDFTRQNPPAALIEAVEHGSVDVAIAWGPLAGYFAKRARVPLVVVPVPNQFEQSIPLAFSISMGVRRGDTKLLAELNAEIEHRKPEIRRLLQKFGVPLVPGMEAPVVSARR